MYPEDQQARNYPDEEIDAYRKSQKDNSEPQHHKYAKVILVISAIILLTIIGGLTYLLSENKEPNSNSSVVNTEVSDDQPAEIIADTSRQEVKDYSVEEYGFSFDYPAAWGEVSLVDGDETEHLVSGAEKYIKFSGNPNVIAGFKTKDWAHDPVLGHDGIDRPGDITFEDSTDIKDYVTAKNIYTNENNRVGYVNLCYEFCSQDHPKTIAVYSTKVNSSNVEVVEFFYYGDVFGGDYTDKVTTWNVDKLNDADISLIMPKTDFRVLELDQVSKSLITD